MTWQLFGAVLGVGVVSIAVIYYADWRDSRARERYEPPEEW